MGTVHVGPFLPAVFAAATLAIEVCSAEAVAESWFAPAPPVVEDLFGVDWGGASGNERFVAVGANGTILTSSDLGKTWTKSASGTNAELRAVVASSHASIRAVAVGANGTILTSGDFAAWVPRASGTSETLRGVERGSALWLAVGDHGTVCRSANGIDWTATTYPGAPHLRAVVWASFIQRFVFVGTQGTTAETSDGVNFRPIGSGSSLDFLDIAVDTGNRVITSIASSGAPLGPRSIIIGGNELVSVGGGGWVTHRPPSIGPGSGDILLEPIRLPGSPDLNHIDVDLSANFVAVGSGGRIWTTNPEAAEFPIVSTAPGAGVDTIAVAGSAATLRASVTSTAPLQARWRRDGAISDLGFSETLTLPDVRYGDSGKYACTVTNSSALLRLERTLTVLPAPASLLGITPLEADPVPPSPDTGAPLVLPDDRYLTFELADNALTLRRFLPDHSPDPVFTVAPIALTDPYGGGFIYGSVSARLDGNGRILVSADGTSLFPRYHGTDLLRFAADGEIDPTFERRWHSGGHLAVISATAGSILCEFSSISPSTLMPGTSVNLARLFDDGSLDPAWAGLRYSSSLANNFQLPTVVEDGAGGFYILRSRLTNEDLPKVINTGFAGAHWIEHYDANLQRVRDISATFDVDFSTIPPGAFRVISMARLGDGTFRLAGNFVGINGVAAPGLALVVPDYTPATTRLANLSVRAGAGRGDESLILGVALVGKDTRPILTRGVGPGLTDLGVVDPLDDPTLRLLRGDVPIGFNDNWGEAADPDATAEAAQRLGAFPLQPDSDDSALFRAFDAGGYTIQIEAGSGLPGVALAEVYDHDESPADFCELRIVNLSARAHIGAGEGTIIAGFVVTGPNTIRLLVRAVGPGLAAFGVPQPVGDPRITLFADADVVAENDDWAGNSDVEAAAGQVGAFPLVDSREAALVATLAPGAYTVHVESSLDDSGIALVEIYELP